MDIYGGPQLSVNHGWQFFAAGFGTLVVVSFVAMGLAALALYVAEKVKRC